MTLAHDFIRKRLETQEADGVGPELQDFGAPFVAIMVPQLRHDDTQVVMILFKDLSAFFATLDPDSDAPAIDPWPEEDYSDAEQEIFSIGEALVSPTLIATMMSPNWDPVRIDTYQDPLEISQIFGEAARAVSDPPEGLLEFIVDPDKEFEWTDPDNSDQALTLLAQTAYLLCGSHTEFEVRSAARQGQSPTQRRKDEAMHRFLQAAGVPRWVGQEANYAGKAYASLADTAYDPNDPPSREEMQQWLLLASIMAEISVPVLEGYGRPEGWSTQYNDDAAERCSGYSADAQMEMFETTFLSAHEIIEARDAVREVIREHGLKPRLMDIIAKHQSSDHSFAALLRDLD